MSRIELILKLQKAIRIYESAVATGDQVSMDCAELMIEECRKKLGIENAKAKAN